MTDFASVTAETNLLEATDDGEVVGMADAAATRWFG